jgi:NAD(P)-dependent dehydrogenase (short-subunit alcohol dehydrogenase family)
MGPTYPELEGRNVLLLGSGPPADAIEAAFATAGSRVTTVSEGLADRELLRAALEQLPARVDILVSCVEGDPATRPIAEVGDAAWREAFDGIVGSAYHAARAVVPRMTGAGGGCIVLVSSQLALNPPWSSNAGYAAAKGGLLGLCRHLAKEFGGQGVRSNTLIPALTEREWQAVEGSELEEAVLKATPLGRRADPSEAASVVLFLAADGSGYVNGATVHASGGRSM